jgi:hypothetical protein
MEREREFVLQKQDSHGIIPSIDNQKSIEGKDQAMIRPV